MFASNVVMTRHRWAKLLIRNQGTITDTDSRPTSMIRCILDMIYGEQWQARAMPPDATSLTVTYLNISLSGMGMIGSLNKASPMLGLVACQCGRVILNKSGILRYQLRYGCLKGYIEDRAKNEVSSSLVPLIDSPIIKRASII